MATRPKEWTRADLEQMPDDGNRYEVIDGVLFVSPCPTVRHERLVSRLLALLMPYVETHGIGEVFAGRHAVIIGESHVEPDLTVFPRGATTATQWADMPRPLLVVEVLSPGTARVDKSLKRDLYRRGDVAEYWIVDGDAREVLVLGNGIDRCEADRLQWRPDGSDVALELDLRLFFAE